MIPYYYLWSDKYLILSLCLKEFISHYSDTLELRDIYLEQKLFDEQFKNSDAHFLCGVSLKIEKTYELLCSLEENSYFIFSDADIIIFKDKPLKELLEFYMKLSADIVYMKESCSENIANNGFIFLKVCDENRKLFKNILDKFIERPEELDMTLFNEELKNYEGLKYFFPTEIVATTTSSRELEECPNWQKMRKNHIIFQTLCNATLKNPGPIEQKLMQYNTLEINVLDILKKYCN